MAPPAVNPLGLVLDCEGMGDCLYALAVIRKMHLQSQGRYRFELFTHHPALFRACPYIAAVFPIDTLKGYSGKALRLFELDKLPHSLMDTFDFISIPLGLGQLSFREKQLEYFPAEPDTAETFDVVLNTSMTWPTRSWPLAQWQRLADALARRGHSVAVVGRDVESKFDKRIKRSPALEGCRNLANQLSLDQTYYTISRARLFVSGQGGLSVLAGATDTEIVVLDMSIEWSKRAIYRHESPLYKVTYVKGECGVYCGAADACPLPQNRGELRCLPAYEKVEAAALSRLEHPPGR
jgi:ADP-heptose:LPS heptosyltransferase